MGGESPFYTLNTQSTYRIILNNNTIFIKNKVKMKRKHLICKWQGIWLALLWTVSLGTFAQTITVRGTVVDDTGLTVIGASVVVENDRTIGTITDIDGKYVLENVPSEGNSSAKTRSGSPSVKLPLGEAISPIKYTDCTRITEFTTT